MLFCRFISENLTAYLNQQDSSLFLTKGRRRPARLARILYMSTLSVADARAQFSKLVESAASTHERFDVTRNGDRVAVLMGADDYDALLDTLDVLSDSEAMADLREAQESLARGESFSEAEVRAAVKRRLSA
ncbi:type II toxin-antitoxin system Phd/YefM family antitoxin [uncultured Microbacterium sp.]|uniref:type II toxin-antitoxin system Phd/YefM family antitoxin n=2 Tax=uncultured Microbacterium sp. TaxID=191216 RepID=UPI00263281D3|nr:type II toxin-antitoxin system Phd/YefM family antitoxin [uncultured Microbacterium sp.]